MRFTGILLIFIFLSISSFTNIKSSIKVEIYTKELCKKMGLSTDDGRNCYLIKGIMYSLSDRELESFINHPELGLESNKAKYINDSVDKKLLQSVSPRLIFSIIEMIEGEKCLISGQNLIPGRDVVLLVKGRRYPYKKEALPQVIANPEKHLGKLQPKGALFHETMGNEELLSKKWLYIGIYFLIGFIFAGLSSQKAIKKNKPLLTWFFAGFFFNILAYIFISAVPPNSEPQPIEGEFKTADPVICPSCGAENHPSIEKCYQCSHPLTNLKKASVS